MPDRLLPPQRPLPQGALQQGLNTLFGHWISSLGTLDRLLLHCTYLTGFNIALGGGDGGKEERWGSAEVGLSLSTFSSLTRWWRGVSVTWTLFSFLHEFLPYIL